MRVEFANGAVLAALGWIRALTVGVKVAAWVSDTGSELNCVDRVVCFLPDESNGG